MKQKLVVDCNVVISAGLTDGVCRQAIFKALKQYHIIVTDLILQEYRGVITRRKFLKFEEILMNMVSLLEHAALIVEDKPLEGIVLPDEDDLIYIHACLNSGAKYLVTGNIKDFPDKTYQNVEVVLPKEFLDINSESNEHSRQKILYEQL